MRHARPLRYSRRGGAHHSSPVLLPCRPSHPDFNVTIRRVPEGTALAGFDYHPSEGFVVPGSDIEDRDGTGFHAVLELHTTISICTKWFGCKLKQEGNFSRRPAAQSNEVEVMIFGAKIVVYKHLLSGGSHSMCPYACKPRQPLLNQFWRWVWRHADFSLKVNSGPARKNVNVLTNSDPIQCGCL